VETTVALNGMQVLPVATLPQSLQSSSGPKLQRRDGVMALG
jgi:hypothetical protein